MRRNGGRWWCVLLMGLGLVISGCTKTHIDLTLHGGFGYVINPDLTVEAGFMKSIDDPPNCTVTQLGVVLTVDDGTIVSPAVWPRSFPVTDSIVTFDGIGKDRVDLNGVLKASMKFSAGSPSPQDIQKADAVARTAPAGTQPSPRFSENDWKDLFWTAHTRLNYLDRGIDPQWRTNAVTGRIVLSGGEISAGIPSDPAAVNGIWEFRAKNHTPYKQAITDRLHYSTDIGGGRIVINLANGAGVTQHIVVVPVDGRKTVGLILAGRHTSQMPIMVNDKLEHFCTFYQLLTPANRPPADEQLVPYFLGNGSTSTTVGASAQPTPGYYCPGDWP